MVGEVGDHGGSIGRARALFPTAPEPFVDLSTGINPHSYPLFNLPATAFKRLPEPGRLRDLCTVAARAYGAPSPSCLAAAPGTQILLPRVAELVRPGKARVLGPTYAEHGRTAALAGHVVTTVDKVAALASADLAIVVNPNNPDGRLVERPVLLELAARLATRGGLLVVDEAFMDVGGAGFSLAGDAGTPGLVVLRSFGKFFGLAGVRLGFAFSTEDIASRLTGGFGPWAVSGPALDYGIRALADHGWQSGMRARLKDDAQRLDVLLARFDVKVTGGTSLFRFVELAQAPSLFDALGGAGIVVRRFDWNPAALRFGLPGSEEEWTRLAGALQAWRQSKGPSR